VRYLHKYKEGLALPLNVQLTYNNEYSVKLSVFENRALRRIFGPKRDEVTGEWRKLHYDDLHGLYSSPNIVRVMK
jgi:hypothetical protein